MAEHILGMGTKKSVREIVALAEQHIGRLEGIPCKLIARTPGLTVEASRPDQTGAFDAFLIRIRKDQPCLNAVREAVADLHDVCTVSETDEWVAFDCRAHEGDDEDRQVLAAVEKISTSCVLPEVWRAHGEGFRTDPISVELLFLAMLRYKASDVHLSPGVAPYFRVDNDMRPSELIGKMSSVQIEALIQSICTDEEWQAFKDDYQTSFNYHQVGLGYSRVSAFYKAGAPHVTFRFLPENIPSFEDLNIPRASMEQLAALHHGLILVTGMTGSGKSTTVAALVDWINTNKSVHILTIENPVEYVHRNKRAIVSQRNTGKDVRTFDDAVTGALRHDPDVIVIGEMRDPDTIRSAINAAATGHLVISTLHANTASEVVNRIVSFFDPVERDLVKLQLRDCVRCVICQRLVPRVGGGRVPALEFMFNDIKPISDGIVAGDTDAIRIGIQQSVSHSFLFEEYLNRLQRAGTITLENARAYSTQESTLNQMIMGTYSIPRLDSIKTAREGGAH